MRTPDWIKPFREPRTDIRCINGTYYKYSVRYEYDSARKRTVTRTVRLLGKITREQGFIPSPKNKLRSLSARGVTKVDIKTYGDFAVFETLLAEEIALLREMFGDARAESLLSFSLARWSEQSPIKRADFYHRHNYCSERWQSARALNDKAISETLRYFGENRQMVAAWMKALLPKGDDKGYFLMDSTHIPSKSGELDLCANGHSRAAGFGRQIRLMYIFSTGTRRPVYYRGVNGNIPDVKSMAQCVREAGIVDALCIADKGFSSAANMRLLDDERLPYIIPLRRGSRMVDYGSVRDGTIKSSANHFFHENRVIWFVQSQAGGRTVTLFLDDTLRAEEEADYLRRVETHPGRSTDAGFQKRRELFGTLAVVSSMKKDAQAREVYQAYKQRNEVEAAFDAYKTFLRADYMYMHRRHVTEGWLFANFIAMLAYSKLFTLLKEAKLLSHTSPKDVVEFARKIYRWRVNGIWQTSEIALPQQKLFRKLGIRTLCGDDLLSIDSLKSLRS